MSLQSSMRLQDMCKTGRLKTEVTTSCVRCFEVMRDTWQEGSTTHAYSQDK